MDAHKLTLHYIFIAVSLPYLTESKQHACFPRTGHDETSIPTGGLLSCFWPETICRKKEAEGDYTSKCPSKADIRDGEGEGMNLISVSHASHGSPC